jgi:hypothetical protein
VAIGVYTLDGRAYIAAAFANDGVKGDVINPDRRDNWCRRTARTIISQRISSYLDGNDRVRFVREIDAGSLSAVGIVNALRNSFKPDPEESDMTFYGYHDTLGAPITYRLPVDDMWEGILGMIDSIDVPHASSRL